MRYIVVGTDEAGQRLDKFLQKFMKDAPAGFFYKMMRKKNITLNGKKCAGSEKLCTGDTLTFFLSEETMEKFGAGVLQECDTSAYERAVGLWGALPVVYEDAHILAVNKPAGILSQKSLPDDLSLNEWMIGYLLRAKSTDAGKLSVFKPSVCNRLDRNTSGLVLCGKSLRGSQFVAQLIKEHRIQKYYRLVVKGRVKEEKLLTSWLAKDSLTNQAHIFSQPAEGARQIQTRIRPLGYGSLPGKLDCTYVEAQLFTGKTHQIRAQLSDMGHPILGDVKYGDSQTNGICRKFGVKRQLLHAFCVTFPGGLEEPFAPLGEKTVMAPLPHDFADFLERLHME